MPRKSFLNVLTKLHDDLVKMSVMSEVVIDEAINALERKDIALAHKVIVGDDHIDNMQVDIERSCMEILSSQQPVASDARMIISILKMTTDIERIADHAADISEITIEIADEEYLWNLDLLHRMSEFVKQMIKDSIRSYIDNDIILAKRVCECDNEVDNLFAQSIQELNELMAQNPKSIVQCTKFIFICKYLERIADHAENLAEWVMYSITGDFVQEIHKQKIQNDTNDTK